MNEGERRLLDTVKFTEWVVSFADPLRELIGVENYAYTAKNRDSTALVAAGQDFPIIMDSDSEFVVTYMSACCVSSDAPDTHHVEFTPSLLLQVTDQSSGKTFFNTPTPLPLVCGAGGFPFLLSSPRIIKPRSTLTVSLSQYDPAMVFHWPTVTLGGAKLYYAGPSV